MKRSVRTLRRADIELVVSYFHQLDDDLLRGMGVDPAKLPGVEEWHKIISDDLARPVEEKQFYYLIWEFDDQPVGHCNINKISYGKEAFMHLHLWRPTDRHAGHGTSLVKISLERFFEMFRLETIYCEPLEANDAPNKTLPKVGFQHIKTYETVPGWINYLQTVNRWQMDRSSFPP